MPNVTDASTTFRKKSTSLEAKISKRCCPVAWRKKRSPSRVTVITNDGSEGQVVVARSRAPRSTEQTTTPIGLAWPEHVYSLSHLAVPCPPDDPLYGYLPGEPGQASTQGGLALGRVAWRGEKNVLRVPAAQLLRLRANPFHTYLLQRIQETIDAGR